MDQADKDGTGDIDMLEFKGLMAKFIKDRNPKEELRKAFRMYDDDDGGTISFDNLKKVSDELQQNNQLDVTDADLVEMLKLADKKHGGTEVDFNDFMRLMEEAKMY